MLQAMGSQGAGDNLATEQSRQYFFFARFVEFFKQSSNLQHALLTSMLQHLGHGGEMGGVWEFPRDPSWHLEIKVEL